jgi:putative Mg2+ transporter-C (MgtC) family protein
LWSRGGCHEAISQDLWSGSELPAQVVVLRLVGAAIFCGLIGVEREWTHHPAGLRTHMLVVVSTALFALVVQSLIGMFADMPGNVEMDPVRLLQAIGAAVGFPAAGVVVFSKGEVKGLTTGAGLWVACGIGLAAGLGLWLMAALTAVLAAVINFALKPVDRRLDRD